MIEAIIFDFGNVFINLDKEGTIQRTKNLLGYDIITESPGHINKEIFIINDQYEMGLINTDEFLKFYTNLLEGISKEEVKTLWNSLLSNFPLHRLHFIRELQASKRFKLFLLSNINDMHINWIKENVAFYKDFESCFDGFYLSHEMNLRKPNENSFQFVLDKHNLLPNKTLFIDDTKENIVSANSMGFHTWHIDSEKEDVINLLKTKKDLLS